MEEKYEIDKLDQDILAILLQDARTPYLEIARSLIVSGGTIHQRIDKMKEAGIIQGSKIILDRQKLGYDVTVFLGIHLESSRVLDHVIAELEKIDEVVEAYFTTGNFALLIKVVTKSIQEFQVFLSQKLQAIDGIRATESFINLSQPINRELKLVSP